MVTDGPKDGNANAKSTKENSRSEDDWQNDYEDPHMGLINQKSSRRKRNHFDALSASWAGPNPKEWQRPYWLGTSLCLILFAFWMLDSLKDPIFGDLANGNLKKHQPIAKLVSVATTLALVLFLEFLSNAKKEWKRRHEENQQRSNESVLDGGGTWSRMGFQDDEEPPEDQNNHAESSSLVYILVSYIIAFAVIAWVLQYHPRYSNSDKSNGVPSTSDEEDALTYWHFVGYFIYATIESFGSLAVASFWSFTNTTLSLEDAERYYGPIIAIAQLGAIGGSTMVTTAFTDQSLIYLACLVITLHLVVMSLYSRRFRPTNIQAIVESEEDMSQVVEPFAAASRDRRESIRSLISATSTKDTGESSSLWSGVHLILRHNYVLLVLGVSCLYEVSLTCLDYQMKLIGYSKFESNNNGQELSFVDFMGHYGQVVNATSLFLSLFGFPFLIRRFGLRYTLRLFPTLLVIATIVAFGAIPANLVVLFTCLSILKAMTYSIHDPSKELLYLPTSNTIKFKAKFWIDVVCARCAKAVGSTINTYAGSVDRSVSVGSMPSLLTAALLWAACYRAGTDFDKLVESGTIVGLEDSPTKNFSDIHSGIYLTDEVDDEQQDGDDPDNDSEFVSNSPERPQRETIELHELRSAIFQHRPKRVSV